MYELKTLSPEALPQALDKAVRYRLLNEPMQAESICLDVLEVEPHNEKALITLVLALTDQFDRGMSSAVSGAREVLERFDSEYHRAYYEGIIWERWAYALHKRGAPGAGFLAYDHLYKAMACYDTAITLADTNNEAILRWNTCVRIMDRHPEIKPMEEDNFSPMLE